MNILNFLEKIIRKINSFYRFFRIELDLLLNIKYDFFGKKIIANKSVYQKLFNDEKNNNYPEIDSFEKLCGYSLDKKWLDELALQTQITIKNSKLNYQHGRVLYSLLRKYLEKNDNITIIETGTSRGFSSICMSKAILDSKKSGRIYTIDILPHKRKMIWNCIKDCDGNNSRQEILEPWSKYLLNIIFLRGKSEKILKNINEDHFNFCFLDSVHKYNSVKNEYSVIFKKQRKDDIIIFDDYTANQFDGVVRFVDKMKSKNEYDIKILYSEHQRGYAIATKN